jgi:membrane protein DedA with SNARE-associated domain
MIPEQISFTILKSLRHWGGPGLIGLGIIDSSFLPIPGGMDLVTAVLAAGNHTLWWYYALMSTVGSVVGGYFTYRISKEGGKEALEQRIPKDKIERVDQYFERLGFGTVFVAAIMPPPFPTVPFLAGAGALNYPAKQFIIALASARAVRFTVLAYLASIYGRRVLSLLKDAHLSLPVILSILGALVGIGVAVYFVWRYRRSRRTA